MSQLSDAVHCAYDKGYEQGYLKGKNDGNRGIAMLQARLYKTLESMSKTMMFETGKPIAVIHSDGGQTTFDLGYEQGKKDSLVLGRWMERTRHEHYPSGREYRQSYCSVCGKSAKEETDFCPNCGARMDAQEGDTND